MNKKEQNDFAKRFYYSVNDKTNSFLHRDLDKNWSDLPAFSKKFWIEVSDTAGRALMTYEEDKGKSA